MAVELHYLTNWKISFQFFFSLNNKKYFLSQFFNNVTKRKAGVFGVYRLFK